MNLSHNLGKDQYTKINLYVNKYYNRIENKQKTFIIIIIYDIQ